MGGGGPKSGSPQFNKAFGDMPSPMPKPPNWMDGGKFTARDAIALALASMAESNGGPAMASNMLKMRLGAGSEEKELGQYRRRKEIDQEFEQPTLPPMVRDAEAWANMTPEQKAAYTAYQEVANPIVQRGVDGLPRAFPRGPQLPQGYDPNEWDIIPDPQGGAPTQGQPPFVQPSRPVAAANGFTPPPRLKNGAMTSGRRTPEGNAIVGGVRNSDHLTGRAVDYDGPDLNALLSEVRQLPGHRKSFIHRGHVHGTGDWQVPYFGKNGTRGLRNR